jgi:hypothetical protein
MDAAQLVGGMLLLAGGGIVGAVLKGRKVALKEVATSTEVRDEIRSGVDKGTAALLKHSDFQEAVDKRIDHKHRNERQLIDGKFETLRIEMQAQREMDAAWKVQHAGMHAEQSQSMRNVNETLVEVREVLARLDERTSQTDG